MATHERWTDERDEADAPGHFTLDQAYGWQCGYNAAVRECAAEYARRTTAQVTLDMDDILEPARDMVADAAIATAQRAQDAREIDAFFDAIGVVIEPPEIRYPEVEVELTSQDGNAIAIIGRVVRELKRHGVEQMHVAQYVKEATSDDYDTVLNTTMRWVSVS